MEVYLNSTIITNGIYFIAAMRPSGLHQFQAVNLYD
jgi:hypothetical protein